MRSTLLKSRGILLVAVFALLLGAFGSAGASQAASVTSKQVKKIAAKVVGQQAPTLSVAHATTANTATRATTATNADTATNATNAANAANAANSANAAKLGGADPAAYRDRIASSSYTDPPTAVQALTATQLLSPIPIVVPTGVGFIQVSGAASFSTGNTNVNMWIAVDQLCIATGDDYDRRQLSHTANPTSIAFDHVQSVTPGIHNVRMCTFAGAATFAGNRAMSVRTVADDFNG
jgi:hypothetical protein